MVIKMEKEDIHFNFDEIIEFGALFQQRIFKPYYDLYTGYLSKLQAEALAFVCNNPGKRIKELNLALSIDKQYGSKIVKVLIYEGLITKQESTIDKRNQVLYATEKGIEILGEKVKESNMLFSRKTDNLTKKEKEEMIEAFSKLNNLLTKI
ncbi:MAG TPA: MarR family winged helix-turn-helix transcriptional regulator [Sedimentibacter sp.]|nr:MarR family winged helix-turn-helix transcriptional regulator [Sedimentibacter sp.]